MKLRFTLIAIPLVLAALLATFTALPAVADDVDFSKISCNDFVTGSKDDAVLLLVWIEGYFTKKRDPPIMYGDKAKAHAENIRDYCANRPDANLLDAAKAVIK